LFKIAPAAKYLGFMLGPKAGATQLDLVTQKWKHRSFAICDVGQSLAVNMMAYNMYSVSLWGYKAQLIHLPDCIFEIEKSIVHMMAKIPFHAYGAHGLHNLSFFGLPDARSLRVLNIASLARTANSTLSEWRGWFHKLVASAEVQLGPRMVEQQMFCKPHWDSQPFVCNLWCYDRKNPLAWAHLANVKSVDAKHGLESAPARLEPSWKSLALSCNAVVGELKDACFEHKCQKLISKILLPKIVPCDWIKLLAERLRAFAIRHEFDESEIAFLDSFDWVEWKNMFDNFSPFAKSHILRSLLNAWTTSHRIFAGKTQLCCLFGCLEHNDQLSHYHKCPIIWQHIRQLTGIHCNFKQLCQLGVTLDHNMLCHVALVSYIYHCIKATPTDCSRLPFLIKAFNSLARINICINFTNYEIRGCSHRCKLGVACPSRHDFLQGNPVIFGPTLSPAGLDCSPLMPSPSSSLASCAPPANAATALNSDAGYRHDAADSEARLRSASSAEKEGEVYGTYPFIHVICPGKPPLWFERVATDCKELGTDDHPFNGNFDDANNWEALFLDAMGFSANELCA
jgi:hypothetical protein